MSSRCVLGVDWVVVLPRTNTRHQGAELCCTQRSLCVSRRELSVSHAEISLCDPQRTLCLVHRNFSVWHTEISLCVAQRSLCVAHSSAPWWLIFVRGIAQHPTKEKQQPPHQVQPEQTKAKCNQTWPYMNVHSQRRHSQATTDPTKSAKKRK